MQDNQPGRGLRWLGPLAGPVDRFLSGGKSSDPLYLSNQSIWKRSRRVLLILLPLLAITGVVALSSFQLIQKKSAPDREITAAEIAARTLPDYAAARITADHEVTVLEAEIKGEAGERVLFGRVRNNTDRRFAAVDIVFHVTNNRGAQLGAERVTVEDLRPRGILPFETKVKPPDAVFALVRDVRTR